MKTPVDQSPKGPDPQGLDEKHASGGDAQRQAQTTDNIADLRLAYARIIREQMREWWDEISSDTGCHPLDMKHGRGTVLHYSPNHWTEAVANFSADAILALKATHLIGLQNGAPFTDDREATLQACVSALNRRTEERNKFASEVTRLRQKYGEIA